LIKIYKRYFSLVNHLFVKEKAFYFQPFSDKFAYKNSVVGIHSLNNILPSLCDAIGTNRKTSHSLRVTCVTKLFQAKVEEKLIRGRSGHISDALLGYEKSSKAQDLKVSKILNPPAELKQDIPETNHDAKQVEATLKPNTSSVRNDEQMPIFTFDDLESFLFDNGNAAQLALDNNIPHSWNYASNSPINISGNCNVTINQFKI
jgi:hypothetical protein